MKIILTLVAMLLLISTCIAAFVPTENDLKWSKSVTKNADILSSDFNSVLSAAEDQDLTGVSRYCEYANSDASNALTESENFTVSEELQEAKDHYELALNEFRTGTTDIIEGMDEQDPLRMSDGLDRIQSGSQYISLATKELNVVLS